MEVEETEDEVDPIEVDCVVVVGDWDNPIHRVFK